MTHQSDDNRTAEDPYEVGYGRPPKSSQFQPGKSGNPKGRKRKPKSTQDQMRTILSKRITIAEGGQSKRLTLQEVMLRSIGNKAAKGDLRAANFVLNLINSDEAAQTDSIEQSSLSPEDQALFEQMMCELSTIEDTAASDAVSSQSVDPQTEDTSQKEPPRNGT
jgi:hypothetical protein